MPNLLDRDWLIQNQTPHVTDLLDGDWLSHRSGGDLLFPLPSLQLLLQQVHLRSAHARLLLLELGAVAGGVVDLGIGLGVGSLRRLVAGHGVSVLGDEAGFGDAFPFEWLLMRRENRR